MTFGVHRECDMNHAVYLKRNNIIGFELRRGIVLRKSISNPNITYGFNKNFCLKNIRFFFKIRYRVTLILKDQVIRST